MILRRGSKSHPETKDLSAVFESLYGASLRTDTAKLGNAHLVVAEVAVPSDRYLPEPVWDRALALFKEVLRDPVRQGGLFRPDYVQQEKDAQKRTLEGVFNDKAQYAQLKMLETMFRGDPYSQTRYGRLEDVDAVSQEALEESYQSLLMDAPLAVYAVGDIPEDAFFHQAQALFGDLPRRGSPPLVPPAQPVARPVQRAEEIQDVNQGKLVMGYRAGRSVFDESFPSLSVASGIFGGYSHSKLFQNVREKASLAYYAYSRLDGFKGVMFVQSGIEFKNRDKAEAIIGEQLEDIRQGRFSDEEMEMTVKALEHQLRSSQDSPSMTIMSHYEMDLAGRPLDPVTRLERLRKVKRDDVSQAFSQVQLDTVFFLNGREGGEGE